MSGGIHPEQEAEPLGQALRDSRCRVLFVENEEQLDKALLVRDRCPALQRIVIIDMKGLRDFADPMCESLQSFVARAAVDGDWDAGIAAITAEQPAVLLLPRTGASRTLTHGDALHLVANARSLLPLRAGDERLALLPMCHVMERVLGLYLSLDARVISNYLENPDTAIENLQEVQPTVLATDPRIWQLLHARIGNAAAGATRIAAHAVSLGDRGGCARRLGGMLARVLRAARGPARTRPAAGCACAYIGGAAVTGDRALGRCTRHHHPAHRRPGERRAPPWTHATRP